MKTHGLYRPGRVAAALPIALAVAAGMQPAGIAEAATCMEELDRFERRLHGSGLAATDPETFEALVRQAEETAELRDEAQCLQSVAELNAALPEDPGSRPVSREVSGAADGESSDNPRRPAPPVLMIAGGAKAAAESQRDASRARANDSDNKDSENDDEGSRED